MTYILCVLCIILGVALIRKPDLFWEIEHYFSVRGGEPINLYLVSRRIIGIIVVCATGTNTALGI